jgi:hypothetical protein
LAIVAAPLNVALAADPKERRAGAQPIGLLFRSELDAEAIDDIRLALNESPLLGDDPNVALSSRFLAR